MSPAKSNENVNVQVMKTNNRKCIRRTNNRKKKILDDPHDKVPIPPLKQIKVHPLYPKSQVTNTKNIDNNTTHIEFMTLHYPL